MKALVTYPVSGEHLEALRHAAPHWRFLVVASLEQATAEVVDAEAFLGNRFFLQSLPFAKKLRWMQSGSAGMDLILSDPLAREHAFVLTAAKGVYDDEVADHALALVYALLRDLPGTLARNAERRWERRMLPHLAERTAFVLGFGGVGQAVARRLAAARARLVVIRRGTEEHPVARAMGARCLPLSEGMKALGEADCVVLALPLTHETRGVFGARALGTLKDGAFLVNVGRGGLLDEAALRSAIDRLGGVGLDVFEREPLPPGDWLWSHPRAIVTPHVGRSPEDAAPRYLALVERNVRACATGRPLEHVVNKELGY